MCEKELQVEYIILNIAISPESMVKLQFLIELLIQLQLFEEDEHTLSLK